MDLENIFLKTGDGKIVPMSSIATLEEKAVAPQLSREQQLRAVSLSAGLKDGLALGDAAAWPIQGLIAHFRHEIEQRIDDYAANPHSEPVRLMAAE